MGRMLSVKSVRLGYLSVSTLCCLFLLSMCYFGDGLERALGALIGCPAGSDASICYGISLVVRVSLALFLMHFLLMLCMFARDGFAKAVNEAPPAVKALFVAGMTLAMFLLPNRYLKLYLEASRYVSVIFLLFQSISLVDFGYAWNELWVEKFEGGTPFYGVMLVITSLALLAATVLLNVLNFQTFWLPDCGYNKLSLILVVFLISVMIGLVLLKYNEQSSVMTCLFLASLLTYFNGLALSSFPGTCNPYSSPKNKAEFIHSSIFHIIANIVLAFIVVLRSSLGSQSSDSFTSRNVTLQPAEEAQAEESHAVPREEIYTLANQDKALEPYKGNRYVTFHLFMCFFSVYLVMIFFDWRVTNIELDNWSELIAQNTSGFFVKTINFWVLAIVYLWTLIAPSVLTDREF